MFTLVKITFHAGPITIGSSGGPVVHKGNYALVEATVNPPCGHKFDTYAKCPLPNGIVCACAARPGEVREVLGVSLENYQLIETEAFSVLALEAGMRGCPECGAEIKAAPPTVAKR